MCMQVRIFGFRRQKSASILYTILVLYHSSIQVSPREIDNTIVHGSVLADNQWKLCELIASWIFAIVTCKLFWLCRRQQAWDSNSLSWLDSDQQGDVCGLRTSRRTFHEYLFAPQHVFVKYRCKTCMFSPQCPFCKCGSRIIYRQYRTLVDHIWLSGLLPNKQHAHSSRYESGTTLLQVAYEMNEKLTFWVEMLATNAKLRINSDQPTLQFQKNAR